MKNLSTFKGHTSTNTNNKVAGGGGGGVGYTQSTKSTTTTPSTPTFNLLTHTPLANTTVGVASQKTQTQVTHVHTTRSLLKSVLSASLVNPLTSPKSLSSSPRSTLSLLSLSFPSLSSLSRSLSRLSLPRTSLLPFSLPLLSLPSPFLPLSRHSLSSHFSTSVIQAMSLSTATTHKTTRKTHQNKTDASGSRPTPPVHFSEDMRYTATLTIAPWQIPHDLKKAKGGEDTYFISQEGNVMGVFDGVGGWADTGIDPREYSLSLSEYCREAADEQYLTDPLTVLKYAYDKSSSVTGSSTACVVYITNKEFHAINVGDSGFKIIRDYEIVYCSKEQQHTFNMPHQLGNPVCDIPENGDTYKFSLMDGDIIIIGTDGLFDNTYPQTLLSLVKLKKSDFVKDLAEQIAKEAYIASKSKRVNTPFADNASQHGYEFEGGKEDDITVIVIKYREMHAKM